MKKEFRISISASGSTLEEAFKEFKTAYAAALEILEQDLKVSEPVKAQSKLFKPNQFLTKFNWSLHNIVGHPLSEIFHLLGLESWSEYAHNSTLPKEIQNDHISSH